MRERGNNGSSRPPSERRDGGSRRQRPRRASDRSELELLEVGPVVVTGICGRLGKRLVRNLHRVRPVIGLDRRPFPDRPKDVEHHALDIRSKKAQDVFRSQRIAGLVHLGVMHDPREDEDDHHTWNVAGFQKVLEWVQQYRVPKLVVLSSASVYGPRPDNPHFLTEDAPLLGAGAFSLMRDLVELDMLAQSFFWKHPETETVILRPNFILGSVQNAPSNYLRLETAPTLMGFDPMVQPVHQDDVVRALQLALRPGVRGIFNIAGPTPLPLSKALAMLGRRTLPVPYTLARLGIERLWRWHMTSFPAPELDFIRYVCMVDDRRAREVLGYRPEFDIERTLAAVDEDRWV